MILSEPECLRGISAQVYLRTWLKTTGFIQINNSCSQGVPCFFKKVLFVYLLVFFLAALGLHCCTWTFCSYTAWGPLFLVVRGFSLR